MNTTTYTACSLKHSVCVLCVLCSSSNTIPVVTKYILNFNLFYDGTMFDHLNEYYRLRFSSITGGEGESRVGQEEVFEEEEASYTGLHRPAAAAPNQFLPIVNSNQTSSGHSADKITLASGESCNPLDLSAFPIAPKLVVCMLGGQNVSR